MAPSPPLQVSIPIETEVVVRQRQAITAAAFEAGQGLRIDLDLRRLDWCERLGLPQGTAIHWEKVRTTDVRELSSFLVPLFYRVTLGDGWYMPAVGGKKVYFGVQKHLVGLDLQRKVTTTALRAAVLLAVMGGVGLRGVCWLLLMLFHLDISKSSLARWLQETASQLPDKEQMLKLLLADKPVTQGHLDEIFPCGWGSSCVLVLKDEHGRLLWAEQLVERTADQVAGVLHKLKELGLHLGTFYVDGCEAYRDAIRAIYPEAVIQYDYFHVIQNIWKKLWRQMVAYRKELKERAGRSQTPWYREKLETLAKRLWEQRGLLFKNPDRMTAQESQTLVDRTGHVARLHRVCPQPGALGLGIDELAQVRRQHSVQGDAERRSEARRGAGAIRGDEAGDQHPQLGVLGEEVARQLLLQPHRAPLLLYGQRRAGKTSLLRNLNRLLPGSLCPLFVDLQGPLSRAQNHAGFLFALAAALSQQARLRRGLTLAPLSREALQGDPFVVFEAWLEALERQLLERDQVAILALDEFEQLESAMLAGRLDRVRVLGMLRHLIQHRGAFRVLIAGAHTLDEVALWSSYLINVQTLHLGVLERPEAERLIRQPVAGFPLSYPDEALGEVLRLTGCHPYLLQLLCDRIVSLKNRQPLAQRYQVQPSEVTQAAAEALEQGSMFFADIAGNQVSAEDLPHLLALAQRGPDARLDPAVPQRRLRQREIVDARGAFTIELVRLWFVAAAQEV